MPSAAARLDRRCLAHRRQTPARAVAATRILSTTMKTGGVVCAHTAIAMAEHRDDAARHRLVALHRRRGRLLELA